MGDFGEHSEVVSEWLEEGFFLNERDEFVDDLESPLDVAGLPQQGRNLLATSCLLLQGLLDKSQGG